jgi:multidrug transporter EmrE-like cation transporter
MPSLSFILLAIGGLFLTAGDIVFKYYALGHKSVLYALGLGLYVVGLIFLVKTYETENIAVASAIFVLVNIATLAVASWFLFREPLGLFALIGLGLAAVAIIFLELG